MQVKCIYADAGDPVSVGDVYEVHGADSERLKVENDNGDMRWYPRDWFKVI